MTTQSFGPLSLVHIVHIQDKIFQKYIFHHCPINWGGWAKLLPVVSSKFVLNTDATGWPGDEVQLLSSLHPWLAKPFF